MRNAECGISSRGTAHSHSPLRTPHFALAKLRVPHSHAFTLIELLVVIAVIAILAALTLVVSGSVAKTKYRSIATAELNQIENALEDYKAKYGVYPPSNANPGTAYTFPQTSADFPQLYYELSGVAQQQRAALYVTLDGSAQISTR